MTSVVLEPGLFSGVTSDQLESWTKNPALDPVLRAALEQEILRRNEWATELDKPIKEAPRPRKPNAPKEPKAKRPGKREVKEAMKASLQGTLTNEQATVLEEGLKPTNRGLRTMKSLQGLVEADPWERERAWISDALTQCPLPLTKPTGTEALKIVRETKTGSGPLTVIYTATGLASMPYGRDAYLLDVLISEARKRGEKRVTFEGAIDIMRLAGFDVGGHDYRLFKEALERIGGLHISVTRRGVGKGNFRVVQIQNLDIPTQEEVRRELSGQKRLMQYAFEFSDEFYKDFMSYYSVIPRNILDAFSGAPTEYAIARWIYRRVTKAQSASYIPLEDVHKEIAPSDTNDRRFRAKFEKVLNSLEQHWPDLHRSLAPKRIRRKGSEVLVGLFLKEPVGSLIGDRKHPIGKLGTD